MSTLPALNRKSKYRGHYVPTIQYKCSSFVVRVYDTSCIDDSYVRCQSEPNVLGINIYLIMPAGQCGKGNIAYMEQLGNVAKET